MAIGVLAVLALWLVWPWWWVADRPRTDFEKLRIFFGILLIVALVFGILWIEAMGDYLDGLESH